MESLRPEKVLFISNPEDLAVPFCRRNVRRVCCAAPKSASLLKYQTDMIRVLLVFVSKNKR